MLINLTFNQDALTYLFLIFGGCLGIYQIGAFFAGFKGLWFFRNPILTCIGGFGILFITYIWFFSSANLKMNAKDAAVVEGHEQLIFFLFGAFLAFVVTVIVSSAVNYRGINSDEKPDIGKGLEDLKSWTVFQAFTYRWRNREKNQ